MGQKPKTIVEINGKKYDAISGQLVADDSAPKPLTSTEPTKPTQTVPVNNGRSLGGMTAPAAANPASQNTIKPQAAHSKDIHGRARKGHSLHRTAALASRPSPVESHDKNHDEQPQPARRQLSQNVDSARLHRSSKHIKSTAIAKFSSAPAETAPVQPEALTIPQGQPITSPAISPKDELIAKQLAATAASQPAPIAKKSLKDRVADKLKQGRNSSVIAASLAALLLIGYVTYLNIPRMALRVASGRAGFAAELPGYAPSGFRFSGPVAYSPGELTLQYSSNTDNRYYQVKERETPWDSQTLLDNYVAQETELYSTYQERGLTIYVFDGSTATWVNGGIWYTIDGASQLTSEQLLKIAASL